jgi:hypothetical protein
MTPTASPRHPWKALVVVLAMFAIVHGARATVGSHDHGFTHIHIGDAAAWDHDHDCPDIDVDADDDRDDGPAIDVVDLLDPDEWT